MDVITLLQAGRRGRRGSRIGISVLIFVVSLTLATAIAVWLNSGQYISQEMNRLGFGDITVWINSRVETDAAAAETGNLDEVAEVRVQPLVFAGYEINGVHSDTEGQLLAYEPEAYPYRFLSLDLDGYAAQPAMEPGDIYLSPVMREHYNARIGDRIHFELARDGGDAVFTVKGYFEDPFMGSSMIDMKSFLIGKTDFERVLTDIRTADSFQVLGREGAMLHIFQAEDSLLPYAEFNSLLHERTLFGSGTEFVYSYTSIYGFMLVLQNLFTGFLAAFSAILTFVAMIVMGHSIVSTIEQDYKDMGILKTIGCTSAKLRLVQVFQYGILLVIGMASGLAVSGVAADAVSKIMVTSTGMRIPTAVPYGTCLFVFLQILVIFILFIYLKTIRIAGISPIRAINGQIQGNDSGRPGSGGAGTEGRKTGINPRALSLSLAVRELASGKRRYMGIFMVTVLLVFFSSAIGRMNRWLGPEGEGLMNAFSAADHDLGVQPMRTVDMGEVERMIASYSPIEESYQLAMQNVAVNGVDYTANVINEPERFHLLAGEPPIGADRIVVTEFAAEDLGAGIGDLVTVSEENRKQSYQISGIYECANEMGGNIGMSREGYERIGDINGFIWCYHYILSDSGGKDEALAALQAAYRVDVSVHTNSWSGLEGIVSTMHTLTVFMYIVAALFIFIVMFLIGSRLLHTEQRDMAVYKSIGFTAGRLRLAFTLRFGVVVASGAAVGVLLSGVFADRMIASVLKLFGIGSFHSGFGPAGSVTPAGMVTGLFLLFAYLVSGRVKKAELTALMNDYS